MLWGHRNDPEGMARDLEAFDAWLGGFLSRLRADDLLLITADHGNDPTTPSTDHSREEVPLLALLPGAGVQPGPELGLRATFADLGATVAQYFDAEAPVCGASFLDDLRERNTPEGGQERGEGAAGQQCLALALRDIQLGNYRLAVYFHRDFCVSSLNSVSYIPENHLSPCAQRLVVLGILKCERQYAEIT